METYNMEIGYSAQLVHADKDAPSEIIPFARICSIFSNLSYSCTDQNIYFNVVIVPVSNTTSGCSLHIHSILCVKRLTP